MSYSVILCVILSLFSTGVMSYVSMATPIGPWIAPTVALLALILFKFSRYRSSHNTSIALVTAGASVGGIVATALGFSFPAIYFSDPHTFAQWTASPFTFSCLVACLVLAGGGLGLLCAQMLEAPLLDRQKLPFPIGEMVYKLIQASDSVGKAYQLIFGALLTCAMYAAQIITYRGAPLIARSYALTNTVSVGAWALPALLFDVSPFVWAIGFVTGHLIALPLAVGALSKIIIIDPLSKLAFTELSYSEFILAFCSGMIVVSTVLGFSKPIRRLYYLMRTRKVPSFDGNKMMRILTSHTIGPEHVLILSAILVLFSYFQMAWYVQIYTIVLTVVMTYQLLLIAGRIGLAPLGRFATFVMIPALFLFKLDTVQLIIIATFVELCGGVAADILFGQRLARLSGISSDKVRMFQWIGLCISAFAAGIFLYVLVTNFQLGSSVLCVQKAYARHLMLAATTFNYAVLGCGMVFGLILTYVNINPALVLGGILMPLPLSLGLIVGALIAWICPDYERYIPFWSGVFAISSLWMILSALCF